MSGSTLSAPADPVFAMHRGGKISVRPSVDVTDRQGLAMAYTPGVARVCTAIAETPDLAADYTWVSNAVAVVTDGTAVLGLGDIGPAAAMPVMEGKSLLFKRFAGVDAVPICLACTSVDEIVATVAALAPSFGGINLEDISAPRCFEIEDRLRRLLDIPVFHDDQHGTAIVALAALRSAAKVAGALDTRATDITEAMKLAAADAIAALVGPDAAAGYIVPSQFDERVAPAVAAAVAAQARADGVARR